MLQPFRFAWAATARSRSGRLAPAALLSLGAWLSPADPDLAYRLELVDPSEPRVAIHVACAGDVDGASEFTLDAGWAGLTETGVDLELVEARGLHGPLAHTRPEDSRWRVEHAPGESLELAFELGPTDHRRTGMPPEYYLPILEPGLLHAIGAQTLPAPAHLDPSVPRPIALAWNGFAEAGWSTISSHSAEASCVVTRPLAEFRHALFLAGKLRLSRHEVHDRAVWIAIEGAWSFSDAELIGLATRIVCAGREFFADYDWPYFLIDAIAVGPPGAASSSYGGTALTDSFDLYLSHGIQLRERGAGIPWLLAHELFHAWNGKTITLTQPEALGYWFSEGFTSFYAHRLLARAGLIDGAEELEAWNRSLAELAANPARAVPATRVAEAFWSDPDVERVPYQRGEWIAAYVDHAIRTRTPGRSLDDLMRELVRRARAGGGALSNATLVEALAQATGPEVAERVRAWAVDGIEPALPADLLPGHVLVPVDVPVFDTGFDHELSAREGRIQGVRPEGCAARAGLRDGMRFRSWQVAFGRTGQPVEIEVLDGDQPRRIRYLPEGAPVRGYRVEGR